MESAGTGAVVEPLLTLEREDLTGVLDFVAQGITTRIFVRAGEIVFAEAGTVGETLGRLLIRSGRLSEEHVAAVIRHLTDSLVDGRYVRFGEVLIENGFLTAAELDIALTEQVKEKIMGCVHRGTGAWSFTRNDSRAFDVGSYVVRTRPMLVDATAHLPERRLETILVLNQNRFPEIVAPETILVDEFELSLTEAAILRDLDGTSSFQFLFTSKPALTRSVPLIAALVLGQGVELRTTPAGARQPSETRAVPPEFRTARRARFRDDKTMPHPAPPVALNGAIKRVRPAAPDLPVRGALPSTEDAGHSSPTVTVAQAILPRRSSRKGLEPPTPEAQTRTRDAFERLKTVMDARRPTSKKRRWPDPKDDRERRLMAEAAFLWGRLLLRAEEAERALPGLHRALELRPEEHEYELYVKWAQMIVNETFRDDERRADVQALAAHLVREDRSCALGLSILGHCVMHEGKNEAALRFFERAADLDPRILDPEMLSRLVSTRASTTGSFRAEGRAQSRSEISARKAERGQLVTPLDELFPMPLFKPIDAREDVRRSSTDVPRASGSGHPNLASDSRLNTPQGGLRAEPLSTGVEPLTPTPEAPPITETPHPPPPKFHHTPTAPLFTPLSPSSTHSASPRLPPPSLPPPAAADLQPPPAPARTSAMSPWRLPAHEASANGHVAAASGNTPLSPVAPRTAPPPPPIVAPSPAIDLAPAESERALEDLPTGRPKHGRVIALALAWSGSLAATAAIFYFVGTREAALTPILPTGATNATTVAPASAASATMETTAAPAAGTPSSTAASSAPPSESAAPEPPASSAKVKPVSSLTKDGRPMTTGSLRTPKAHGRRIYVDGHIVGEGGRDLTVPCGAHRVKVGSTGTEKPVSIPCGGLLELE